MSLSVDIRRHLAGFDLDVSVEHLRPRDHHDEDEPPTLLWV